MKMNKRLPEEGYVKYQCRHADGPAPRCAHLEELDSLRSELFDAHLVGMREDGVGFGNVSVRVDGGFVVSATATGSVRELGAEGYSLVHRWSIEGNWLECRSPLPASSEALTHAAVYMAAPEVQCVVHVHSRGLFDGLKESGALATPASAAYGTPEMALAVSDIARKNQQEGVIAMLGHEEGVLFYGPSIAAVSSLIAFSVRNFAQTQHQCGGSCPHGGCHGA